jgi:hypothetical protein
MGMSLLGKKRDEGLNWASWTFLLETAYYHGWKPAGTVKTTIDDWNGTYFGNDGQWVTAGDAAALADALERYLNTAPSLVPPGHRQLAHHFVPFFREGGFEIW